MRSWQAAGGTSASLLKVASEFEINSYGTVLKQS